MPCIKHKHHDLCLFLHFNFTWDNCVIGSLITTIDETFVYHVWTGVLYNTGAIS